MKKLISGMFSSVPDAQLLLATIGDDEDTPANAPDKFSDTGENTSLNRAEINPSIAAGIAANTTSYQEAIDNDLESS